jgi:hypothetical protein
MDTNVSEDYAASIFRVEVRGEPTNQPNKQKAKGGVLRM